MISSGEKIINTLSVIKMMMMVMMMMMMMMMKLKYYE